MRYRSTCCLREIPDRIHIIRHANIFIALVINITGHGVGIFSYLRHNVRTRISHRLFVSEIFGSSFGAPTKHHGTDQDCRREEILRFRPRQRHHLLPSTNSGDVILLGFIWRVNVSWGYAAAKRNEIDEIRFRIRPAFACDQDSARSILRSRRPSMTATTPMPSSLTTTTTPTAPSADVAANEAPGSGDLESPPAS